MRSSLVLVLGLFTSVSSFAFDPDIAANFNCSHQIEKLDSDFTPPPALVLPHTRDGKSGYLVLAETKPAGVSAKFITVPDQDPASVYVLPNSDLFLHFVGGQPRITSDLVGASCAALLTKPATTQAEDYQRSQQHDECMRSQTTAKPKPLTVNVDAWSEAEKNAVALKLTEGIKAAGERRKNELTDPKQIRGSSIVNLEAMNAACDRVKKPEVQTALKEALAPLGKKAQGNPAGSGGSATTR